MNKAVIHHVFPSHRTRKQEPALLILGLDNFPDELLGQLLEWSPTVIATLQIAEKLHAYGIKVDWIIGSEFNEDLQADVKRLSADDGTITEDALKYLVAQGFPAVNIITDEFELKDYQPFADKIDLVVFYNDKRIYPVKPGFSKWKPAGEAIELLTHPQALHTTGLENVGHYRYKTTLDGFFSIQFDAASLFIAEAL